MNQKTKKLVMASLMAALTCIATIIIKIPSPLNGYLNLGDCIVLLTGWILSPIYGFLAAGLGSALADLFSGYILYAPATFAIKGTMALLAFWGYKLLQRRVGDLCAQILSGLGAELIMIVGYYVFEGFLYGFVPSAINIPANGIQGAVGLVLGILLLHLLKKSKFTLE